MHRTLAFLLPWTAACPGLLAQVESAAPASGSDRQPSVYGLWDNDGGIIKPFHNEDKHYTNGVVFGLAHHPQWADDLADFMPALGGGFDSASTTAAGYIIGQTMRTPDDIETETVIEDDNPFAGYSYLGAYWQRATQHTVGSESSSVETFDHVQLELGVVGDWSQAEDVQEFVHEAFGGDEVNGWGNQIDDEVTIQTYARRKWRVPLNSIEFSDTFKFDAQLIPHVGLALGTVYRNVEAAATFRVGCNLPNDFGAARTSDLPAATSATPRGWSTYGFAQVLGKAVEYNHLLEGSDFQDEIHTVEEEPFVGEFTLGAALGYRGDTWEAALRYSVTWLTEEFKDQSIGDDYATLGVSVGARF